MGGTIRVYAFIVRAWSKVLLDPDSKAGRVDTNYPFNNSQAEQRKTTYTSVDYKEEEKKKRKQWLCLQSFTDKLHKANKQQIDKLTAHIAKIVDNLTYTTIDR